MVKMSLVNPRCSKLLQRCGSAEGSKCRRLRPGLGYVREPGRHAHPVSLRPSKTALAEVFAPHNP